LQLLSILVEDLAKENDAKSLIILLYSLGNLLSSNEGNKSIAIDMDVPSILNEMNVPNDQSETNDINELKNYFIAYLK
jgi:hypothetical protein